MLAGWMLASPLPEAIIDTALNVSLRLPLWSARRIGAGDGGRKQQSVVPVNNKMLCDVRFLLNAR